MSQDIVPKGASSGTNLVKFGPIGKGTYGKPWDEMECGHILQIFISHDTMLRSLQFLYSQNGNHVLTNKYGGDTAKNFDAVMLDYPREYLTSVSGYFEEKTYGGFIASITFTSNFRTYGPFGGKSCASNFQFHLGKYPQLIRFFGTGDCLIRSIGVYVNPFGTPNIRQNKCGSSDEEN